MEEKNHSSVSPPWTGGSGIVIPRNAKTANQIVVLANALTPKQQENVIKAVKNESYEMAAEFVWKRSISRLQSILYSLGMNFIGEMLNRSDIDTGSVIENELTEFSTLKLAEQLGIFNSTGAFRLKQSLEIINHFVRLGNAEDGESEEEELSYLDALNIVKNCVQYVLGQQNITVAIEFSRFRDRLLSETLTTEDSQVQQLIGSPAFYLSTTITILLSSIKEPKGATVTHALSNLNSLIKAMWKNLPEKDKFRLGSIYRDTIADGNTSISNGIRLALLKVQGFDYVPETLKSATFSKVAKQIVDTHFSHNNFYNEYPLVKNLANLGTSIPKDAFLDCIQAYLCVYIGNRYGYARDAAPVAYEQLIKIPIVRWEYYIDKVLKDDDIILYKLYEENSSRRFVELYHTLKLNVAPGTNKYMASLLRSINNRSYEGVKRAAETIIKNKEV
ncbi:hypothetical protein GCM10028824_19240 [Hymenobacter segetis]|uniref:Uncharacterized protein n=1 Tax=Hymenobacter segetis TaxID=2025509 RepID=A0ABU9M109_9BACT